MDQNSPEIFIKTFTEYKKEEILITRKQLQRNKGAGVKNRQAVRL